MSANMIIYLLAINVVAFILYGYDKTCAVQGNWRVSEAALLGIAIFGGSIGAFLGMKTFHHKTHKPVFSIGIPVIILVQVIIAASL